MLTSTKQLRTLWKARADIDDSGAVKALKRLRQGYEALAERVAEKE
ncbi:hypothetical protein [Magnetofaba australis]|nr:hypothetical protein [Magnetofaba australis]